MSGTPDLRVNPQTLIDAGKNLTRVGDEFGIAGRHAKEVASLVHHAKLSSAIKDFANKWDSKREELQKGIVTLAQATTAIGEGFKDTDDALAEPLDELQDQFASIISNPSNESPSSGQSDGVAGSGGGSVGSVSTTPESPTIAVTPNVYSPGHIESPVTQQQMQDLQTSAEERLAQMDAMLANLRARLAALHDNINATMEALHIQELIDFVLKQRDALIGLIQGFPEAGGASAPDSGAQTPKAASLLTNQIG